MIAKRTPMAWMGCLSMGLTGPALAEVRLSGIADVYVERLRGDQTHKTRMSSNGLSSSRIVFSGDDDLGAGNSAFFRYEMQYMVDTGEQKNARESLVGLSGPWGSFSMGRQNTPSYWIAGYADPTWSMDYSVVSNMQFFYASFREDNSVAYNTPRLRGFMGRFMVTAGKEDGGRDGRFVSSGIEYREGPLFAGAASDLKYRKDIHSGEMRSSRDNYFALAYQVGNIEPSLIYHRYDGYYSYPPYIGFDVRGWDVQLGARWDITGLHRLVFSFVHKKDARNIHISDANGYALSYQYLLSKQSRLYLNHGRIHMKNKTEVAYPITWNDNGPVSNKGTQIGIRHTF